jgi:hypothetical protein
MPLCIHSRVSSALRGLVLVMGEHQVRAAAVDVEAHAQQLLGHRRALDVPTRPPLAPGRRPAGVLAGLARLPQGEVQGILLARQLRPLPTVVLALVHVLQTAVGKASVAGVRAHAEVDVAARLVGVATLDQGADVLDDRPDRLRREGLVVGSAEAQRVGVGDVALGHLGGELGARASLRARCVVDLVVDVGHVDDQLDLVALVRKEPAQQAEDDERAGVADVDAAVDRGAARVDPDPPGIARSQRLQLAAAGVVEQDLPHRRATLAPRRSVGALQ